MRLIPSLPLYFTLGVLCNIAACDAGNEFGWYVFTAASILGFYCFFSRVFNYLCGVE
jgi:hypothetical protein